MATATITYDFTDRTAVVTGGASGLGRATAEKLAASGAQVVVVDRDAAGAAEVAAALPDGRGHAVTADVTSEDQVIGYVRAAVERLGRIDMFFNNAGTMGRSVPFLEATGADFDAIFDVNIKGVFLGLREVGKQMVRQGAGVVVNTASTAGLQGGGTPLYSSSKWAVVGLTRTVSRTLGPHGVRVNGICPTATPTALFGELGEQVLQPQVARIPLGRLGRPDDIASAVGWLFSDDASFVNGSVIAVDGGFTA
jgi:3alpha(or 20beta)-hydroxysteroid dehydrogenase